MFDLLADVTYWAGTKESLAAYLKVVNALTPERVAELEAQNQARYGNSDDDEERRPRLYKRSGDIGVITIAGSLNNSASWMNPYIGATGYPEIREALIYAARDEGAKAIVLDVKSGGGAVSGVSDTAELVSTIDTQVKPVFAFSDGMMASAAYWLGCSARSVTVSNIAEIGSVGVLMVHQEYSKMLEEVGITATVFRAGKYKALVNPYEKLTDAAREETQAHLEQLYTTFAGHVADRRSMSYADFDRRAGQGRVFIGQAAVDIGLADAVSSFDKMVGAVQRGIDTQNKPPKYGANLPEGNTLKNALTEQDIAALAAGAASAAAAASTATNDTTTDPDTAASGAPEADVSVEPGDGAPVDEPNASAQAGVVDLLKGQVAEAQGKLVDLGVQLVAAKNQAEASVEMLGKLRPLVEGAVGNMRVALGGVRAGVEGMPFESLLAEHTNLSAQFNAKFKAGGVTAAVPITAAKTEGAGEVVSDFAMARLKATRQK